MNDYSVVINLTKYEFGSSKNTFLEYTVNADGIKPLAGRVEAIVNVAKPATVKQLRKYLDMFSRFHTGVRKNPPITQRFTKRCKKVQRAHRVVRADRKQFPRVETRLR
jgi:hypothetical protein